MCGIVGTAGTVPDPNRNWLAAGCDALTHRGPDDAGEWWSSDGRVGLGHRRLAIIDLSPLGHQPMHMPERGLSIVFNGEIYNHRLLREELVDLGFVFRSHSDTEVLLAAYAAWGEECLTRLNGMFAFALYDAAEQSLFLARDRVGEKPLFYYLANGRLQFASELKALLANPANPRRIDAEAMDCYLAMGYVPGERCILQGFNKLPPAHALRFDLQSGNARVLRYWYMPAAPKEGRASNLITLSHELETLLEKAVGLQMVADVPVGVLLSGGVDSSLVTAMAVRASSQVQTFTVGFPGCGRLDESEHARLVAKHFGTRHTELMASDVNPDLLRRLARQFDEPIADSSMIPSFLVSEMVREHCTVALGGDGGDELFGGYKHYSQLLAIRTKLDKIPFFLRKGIAKAAEDILPVGIKGRNWLQGIAFDVDTGLPLQASCIDARTRIALLSSKLNWQPKAFKIFNDLYPNHPDFLQRATRMDFQNYLPEDILVKVDRTSMMNSLEVRAPFLDLNLVEFAFGQIPSSLKATSVDKKILLKKLTENVLPHEFNRQRKQGFSIPLNDWLRPSPFRKLFNDVLLDPESIFDRKVTEGLFNGFDRGRANGERLFALTVFELWRREYGISF